MRSAARLTYEEVQAARGGGPALPVPNERLDALSRQLEDQQRHLPAGLAEVSDRLDGLRHELDDQRRRAPQEGIAEINERLDWLSRQLDLIA